MFIRVLFQIVFLLSIITLPVHAGPGKMRTATEAPDINTQFRTPDLNFHFVPAGSYLWMAPNTISIETTQAIIAAIQEDRAEVFAPGGPFAHVPLQSIRGVAIPSKKRGLFSSLHITLYHWAAELGSYRVLTQKKEEMETLSRVELLDSRGYTPLHVAGHLGHENVVAVLQNMHLQANYAQIIDAYRHNKDLSSQALSALPVEVLLMISNYLPIKDQISLKSACHRTQKCLEARASVSVDSPQFDGQAAGQLFRIFPNLTSLDLTIYGADALLPLYHMISGRNLTSLSLTTRFDIPVLVNRRHNPDCVALQTLFPLIHRFRTDLPLQCFLPRQTEPAFNLLELDMSIEEKETAAQQVVLLSNLVGSPQASNLTTIHLRSTAPEALLAENSANIREKLASFTAQNLTPDQIQPLSQLVAASNNLNDTQLISVQLQGANYQTQILDVLKNNEKLRATLSEIRLATPNMSLFPEILTHLPNLKKLTVASGAHAIANFSRMLNESQQAFPVRELILSKLDPNVEEGVDLVPFLTRMPFLQRLSFHVNVDYTRLRQELIEKDLFFPSLLELDLGSGKYETRLNEASLEALLTSLRRFQNLRTFHFNLPPLIKHFKKISGMSEPLSSIYTLVVHFDFEKVDIEKHQEGRISAFVTALKKFPNLRTLSFGTDRSRPAEINQFLDQLKTEVEREFPKIQFRDDLEFKY
jgi:hypothetical protein